MGIEDFFVLVYGFIVLVGFWGGSEFRGSMRFCRWREVGRRKK